MTAIPLPENWDTIAGRSSFLGKEHFVGFQRANSEEFSLKLAGAAFNGCVGGKNPQYSTEATSWGGRRITGFARFQPRGGLIVAKREDVGLEPYFSPNTYPNLSTVCQAYAIEAGSLAELQPELNQMKRSDVFLRSLTNLLIARLAEQEK